MTSRCHDPAGMRDDLAHLLDGLDGSARDARIALVERLLASGCPAEQIAAAHAADRLALLPLEHALRADGSQTLEEIAEAHGVEVEALEATRHALGLPVERGRAVYGDALGQHATRLAEAVASGVPVEALVTINRTIGRSMAAIADASRDVMQQVLAESEPDESVRALLAAEAAEALVPQLEQVLGYALQEHVREMLRQEAGTRLIGLGGEGDVWDVGIAFADLEGFSRLGDELPADALGEIAGRLEALVLDVRRPDVQLVKTIGDEVMLASSDLPALVATVLDLLAAADADGSGLPRLRAGAAAGPTMRRAGDWYGRPVNLASRLTAAAEPGALLADATIRKATEGDVDWAVAGEQALKGFEAPVAAFAARPG
jgi:adenylate cyclase